MTGRGGYVLEGRATRVLVRVVMRSLFQGLRLKWFLTRPRTRGVSAFCVTPEGRLVLVRSTYERGWNLPSGGLSADETCEAAILRELREEIGLVRHDGLEELGAIEHRPNFKRDRETVFLLTGVVWRPVRSLEIERIEEFAGGRLPPDVSGELSQRWERFGADVAARLRAAPDAVS